MLRRLPEVTSLLRGLLENRMRGHRVSRWQRCHETSFFAGIDWHKLVVRQCRPPPAPGVKSDVDVSNFDSMNNTFCSLCPEPRFRGGGHEPG